MSFAGEPAPAELKEQNHEKDMSGSKADDEKKKDEKGEGEEGRGRKVSLCFVAQPLLRPTCSVAMHSSANHSPLPLEPAG
jgi:hypothetical protein